MDRPRGKKSNHYVLRSALSVFLVVLCLLFVSECFSFPFLSLSLALLFCWMMIRSALAFTFLVLCFLQICARAQTACEQFSFFVSPKPWGDKKKITASGETISVDAHYAELSLRLNGGYHNCVIFKFRGSNEEMLNMTVNSTRVISSVMTNERLLLLFCLSVLLNCSHFLRDRY